MDWLVGDRMSRFQSIESVELSFKAQIRTSDGGFSRCNGSRPVSPCLGVGDGDAKPIGQVLKSDGVIDRPVCLCGMLWCGICSPIHFTLRR